MYVCMLCMYVCMYVCVYMYDVCMHACMHVCMYVRIYVHLCTCVYMYHMPRPPSSHDEERSRISYVNLCLDPFPHAQGAGFTEQ